MDYEKKYKETLEKARQLCAYPTSKPFISDLQDLFPELAESDDERIRKELLDFCKNKAENFPNDPKYKNISAWIAWLEKQGQKPQGKSALEAAKEEKVDDQNCVKPADKIQIGKKYKCIASPRYSTFIKGFIYIPQDKFLCSLMNFCSDCFELIEDGEQKPTDKTEPKFKVGQIITDGKETVIVSELLDDGSIRVDTKSSGDCWFDIDVNEADKWRLVENPAEWSEEDEKAINDIMWIIEAYRKNGFNETHIQIADSSEKWLKSLKERVQPQNTWKPSDEQMEALKGVQEGVFRLGILKSLYQDLKKLK